MAYPPIQLMQLAIVGHNVVSHAVKAAPFRQKVKAEEAAIFDLCKELYRGIPGQRADLPGGRVSEAESTAHLHLWAYLKWIERAQTPLT